MIEAPVHFETAMHGHGLTPSQSERTRENFLRVLNGAALLSASSVLAGMVLSDS